MENYTQTRKRKRNTTQEDNTYIHTTHPNAFLRSPSPPWAKNASQANKDYNTKSNAYRTYQMKQRRLVRHENNLRLLPPAIKRRNTHTRWTVRRRIPHPPTFNSPTRTKRNKADVKTPKRTKRNKTGGMNNGTMRIFPSNPSSLNSDTSSNESYIDQKHLIRWRASDAAHKGRLYELTKLIHTYPHILNTLVHDKGMTLLTYAVAGNQPKTVQFLLDQPGIDIYKTGSSGLSGYTMSQWPSTLPKIRQMFDNYLAAHTHANRS